MSERILTPIIDLVEQSPDVDNREVFNELWAILAAMHDKIKARFELTLDPCSERFNPFVSRDLYTRVAMTPTAVGYTAKADPAVIEKIRGIAFARLDRWLGWVDTATPTPVADRPAIAARDEQIRRNICVRDPANTLGDRLFGKENAAAMVETLWGGARTLPRPTGD